MKLNLPEIIKNICYEVIRTDASFMHAQRIAYLEIFKNEYDKIIQNHNFLTLDEITIKLYLKPVFKPWYKKWIEKLFNKNKKQEEPIFQIVNPTYPQCILCDIIIKRKENQYDYEILLNNQPYKASNIC